MYNPKIEPMNIFSILGQTFKRSFTCFFKHLPTHLLFGLIYLVLSAAVMATSIFFLASNTGSGFLYMLAYMPQDTVYSIFSTVNSLVTLPLIILWYAMVYNIQLKGFLQQKTGFGSNLKVALKRGFFILLAVIIAYIIPLIVTTLGLFYLLGILLRTNILIILFLAIIFSLLLASFLISLIPVIIDENRGPIKAIGRSFKLSSYSYSNVLGSMLFFLIVSFSIILILTIVSAIVFFIATIFGDLGQLIVLIIGGLLLLPLLPLAHIIPITFSTLIYFNQKIKHESFGVEKPVEQAETEEPEINSEKGPFIDND